MCVSRVVVCVCVCVVCDRVVHLLTACLASELEIIRTWCCLKIGFGAKVIIL